MMMMMMMEKALDLLSDIKYYFFILSNYYL